MKVTMKARAAGGATLAKALGEAGLDREYAVPGDELELPAATAKQLIAGGFASEVVVEKAAAKKKPAAREKAKAPRGEKATA